MATKAAAMSPDITANQVESRILNGTLVDFGPGADVLYIKHPADYSAIHFSCEILQRNAEYLAAYMFESFSEPVGLSRIHIISGVDSCSVVAHVRTYIPLLILPSCIEIRDLSAPSQIHLE